MDELGSVWTTTAFQESTDELKKKLMYSSLELESVKSKVTESQENVTNLLNLLESAYQERDQAREQLKKIFDNPNPAPIDQLSTPVLQPVSPPVLTPTTTKANLSLTGSNSPSSVDSCFFDHAVSSPEFPGINMTDSSCMGFANAKQPNVVQQLGTSSVTMTTQTDLASQTLDNLSKGKILPEIGKLTQAVSKAGPLLRTLLIAGPPLPRWRNLPPPFQKPIKIPPVYVDPITFNRRSPFLSFSTPSTRYVNVNPHTSSLGNAMLTFNSVLPTSAGASGLYNPRMITTSNSSTLDHQFPFANRQRLL